MPSLSDYIQEVLSSEELNEWEEVTVTTAATGLNDKRTIIASELIDEDSDADITAYGGWHAFDLTTYEQQRVRNAANFTPSTGTLLMNGEFTAVLPVGRRLWLVRRMGIVRQKGRSGLRDAVNEALKDLAVRFEITLTAGTRRTDGSWDVSAYSWLTQDRIIELRRSITSNSPPWLMPGMPTLRVNGATKYLVPPGQTGPGSQVYGSQDLTLVVARPSHTYIMTKKTARATATVSGGAITAIAIADAGEGYTSAPTVTITGAGTGATATATLSGDSLASISVGAGGSGYVSGSTTVTISVPAGIWGDSTAGLVNLEDEALPSLDDVMPGALWHCYLSLMTGPTEDTTYWKILADAQATNALEKKWKSMPRRERNDDLLEDGLGAIDESLYSWPD